MMNGTKHIIKKELTRVFSDKKLIFSLFILPAVLILGMYSVMGAVMKNLVKDIEAHIPSVYIQGAPEDFVQFIETTEFEADLTYISYSEDTQAIKDGILDGSKDLLVVFEEGFEDKIANYKAVGDPIPEVKTYYNTAENYSNYAREDFVSLVLYNYQQSILSRRLGNMEQLQVFYIDKDPETSIIVNEKKEGGRLFANLLPFLVNIMLFAGAMGLGVDAITGEKERGTLSSMLLAPINRGEIVFGKLVGLAVLSSISAAVYAVSIIASMPLLYSGIAGDAALTMKLQFTLPEIIQLLVIMLAVVYLYVSLVALVAVQSRTSKEANTYVVPAYILVMLGSVFTFTGTGDTKLINFFIPVYNSAVSIQNLLLGELTIAQFGATIGTLILFAAFVTYLITKAFNSEKVMFNA